MGDVNLTSVWKCGVCDEEMLKKTASIACITCRNYIHLGANKCAQLTYKQAVKVEKTFQCIKCTEKQPASDRTVLSAESTTSSSAQFSSDPTVPSAESTTSSLAHQLKEPTSSRFKLRSLQLHSSDDNADDSPVHFILAAVKSPEDTNAMPVPMIVPDRDDAVMKSPEDTKVGDEGKPGDMDSDASTSANEQATEYGRTKAAELDDMDCSDSDASSSNDSNEQNNNSDEVHEPYELISTKGNMLGKVIIIKTNVDELVHGRTLEKGERKVLVIEVYEDHRKEAEEEFIDGAFLRVDRLMLRRIPFARKGSKKKGRGQKLGLSPKKWARNRKKKMRNSGQSYISSSGKTVPGKKFVCVNCNCKHKQCKELTEEARQSAHKAFWAMGDYNDQNAYLLTLVSSTDKKSAKVKKEGVQSKPKSKTRNYTINKLAVCKEVFKSTFSISNGRVGRLLSHHDRSPNDLPKDKR